MMASIDLLTLYVKAETHGALEDGRIGVLRRTFALWFIGAAQWLLKSRIDISIEEPRQ